MSKSIDQLVGNLPEKSVTVYMLNSLDYVVPGEWQNFTDFDESIKAITGETDSQNLWEIRQKSLDLYNNPDNGYQRAMWIYQKVDQADAALGMAAMANKVGERIGFLSFLNKLTPKADNSQIVDLSLKLVAELLAFTTIKGIPSDKDGIQEFAVGLKDYGSENIMRMAALVAIDGAVPLGPNFVERTIESLQSLGESDLGDNPVFKKIGEVIPGDDVTSKFGFVGDSFSSVQNWMTDFTTSHDISAKSVTDSLKKYIDVTDDKLDYLGAFLDMSTSYYDHTGTQSIARSVIEQAAKEG